jgi:hypothetical protein
MGIETRKTSQRKGEPRRVSCMQSAERTSGVKVKTNGTVHLKLDGTENRSVSVDDIMVVFNSRSWVPVQLARALKTIASQISASKQSHRSCKFQNDLFLARFLNYKVLVTDGC